MAFYSEKPSPFAQMAIGGIDNSKRRFDITEIYINKQLFRVTKPVYDGNRPRAFGFGEALVEIGKMIQLQAENGREMTNNGVEYF